MHWSRRLHSIGAFAAGLWLALVTAVPGVVPVPSDAPAAGDTCVSGPLPRNLDNRLSLCSPLASSLRFEIVPEGVRLSWDAPPRSTSTYVSPVLSVAQLADTTLGTWTGVPPGGTVPSIAIQGTYLAYRDRRIQLDVQSIEVGGGFPNEGTLGTGIVRVTWNSIYETVGGRAVSGLFTVDASNVGRPLRFEVPPSSGTAPPDTLPVAGLRVVFRPGFPVRVEDSAVFDAEDFEGFHVWRWDSDPTSPVYRAIGEYSKLKGGIASPAPAWAGVVPSSRRIQYLDRDVFDGFLYHYAVTTYDQGFRRSPSGTTLGYKIDSPLVLAQRDAANNVRLGPTQARYEYRRPPPAEFRPITAVPNPYRESASDGSRESQFVFFTNAPPRGTLYIFTIAGDLVLQRDHTIPDIGVITWDTRNDRGEKVASGVYIYKIVDLVSGLESFGRLAIIR